MESEKHLIAPAQEVQAAPAPAPATLLPVAPAPAHLAQLLLHIQRLLQLEEPPLPKLQLHPIFKKMKKLHPSELLEHQLSPSPLLPSVLVHS